LAAAPGEPGPFGHQGPWPGEKAVAHPQETCYNTHHEAPSSNGWGGGMKETRIKVAELEASIAELRKERRTLETTGCFSDKELAQKQERLQKLDQRIRLLTTEMEELKNTLRLKLLRG
jgi:hypothetical protein